MYPVKSSVNGLLDDDDEEGEAPTMAKGLCLGLSCEPDSDRTIDGSSKKATAPATTTGFRTAMAVRCDGESSGLTGGLGPTSFGTMARRRRSCQEPRIPTRSTSIWP